MNIRVLVNTIDPRCTSRSHVDSWTQEVLRHRETLRPQDDIWFQVDTQDSGGHQVLGELQAPAEIKPQVDSQALGKYQVPGFHWAQVDIRPQVDSGLLSRLHYPVSQLHLRRIQGCR